MQYIWAVGKGTNLLCCRKKIDFDGTRGSILNEAFSSTLRVYLLETFGFCSLINHTERCQEERYDNGHEAVNSRKCIIQRVICKRCYGRDTEAARRNIVGDRDEGFVSAKSPSYFSGVTCIKIPTALELILEHDAVCYT